MPHVALEWAQASYRAQEVSREALKMPEYLALNPQGAVPLLQDGDWTLSQNIAIIQYLHAHYPQAHLFGTGDSKAQAKAWQRPAIANSDVHSSFAPLFNPHSSENERHAAVAKLLALYGQADQVLQHQDYLAGELSIADVYLYVTLRWAKMLHIDLSALSAIEDFYQRLESNAGVASALKQQGL